MPPVNHFLAIEVGRHQIGLTMTDGSGAVLLHLDRNFGATGQQADPAEWWRTIRTGVKDLMRRADVRPGSIRSIGLCGSLHQVVCVDALGQGRAPTFDVPTTEITAYNQQIEDRCGRANLRNITGSQADGCSMAAHLLWIRDNARRAWHDLQHPLYAHDYLRFKLTGTACTDPSSAAATLLYNTRQQIWSKQLLARLEINATWMPSVQPGGQIAGRVSPIAAKETGLAAGTPVVLVGSQLAACAVALGVDRPGKALIELGGNGSCLITTETAQRDRTGLLHTGCHCLPRRWTLQARDLITNHGIDWLLREVASGEQARAKRTRRPVLDLLAESAAETPPGAEGLLFVPPEDAQSRGGFIGLDYRHGHGHLIRAVLESGPLDLHQIFAHLRQMQVPTDSVTLIGPGASNHLWCQILTDAIAVPTQAVPTAQLCAKGTTILAATATGSTASLKEARAQLALDMEHFEPRSAAVRTYQQLQPQRSALSERVANIYERAHTAP